MSYNIIAVPTFKKELKRLAKKFPSLKNDFSEFLESLEVNPVQGTSLGNNCTKYVWPLPQKEKEKAVVQG